MVARVERRTATAAVGRYGGRRADKRDTREWRYGDGYGDRPPIERHPDSTTGRSRFPWSPDLGRWGDASIRRNRPDPLVLADRNGRKFRRDHRPHRSARPRDSPSLSAPPEGEPRGRFRSSPDDRDIERARAHRSPVGRDGIDSDDDGERDRSGRAARYRSYLEDDNARDRKGDRDYDPDSEARHTHGNRKRVGSGRGGRSVPTTDGDGEGGGIGRNATRGRKRRRSGRLVISRVEPTEGSEGREGRSATETRGEETGRAERRRSRRRLPAREIEREEAGSETEAVSETETEAETETETETEAEAETERVIGEERALLLDVRQAYRRFPLDRDTAVRTAERICRGTPTSPGLSGYPTFVARSAFESLARSAPPAVAVAPEDGRIEYYPLLLLLTSRGHGAGLPETVTEAEAGEPEAETNRFVGVMVFSFGPGNAVGAWADAGHAVLELLCVAPQRRGRGLGERMLDLGRARLDAWLRATHGIRLRALWLSPAPDAREFYARNGFRQPPENFVMAPYGLPEERPSERFPPARAWHRQPGVGSAAFGGGEGEEGAFEWSGEGSPEYVPYVGERVPTPSYD